MKTKTAKNRFAAVLAVFTLILLSFTFLVATTHAATRTHHRYYNAYNTCYHHYRHHHKHHYRHYGCNACHYYAPCPCDGVWVPGACSSCGNYMPGHWETPISNSYYYNAIPDHDPSYYYDPVAAETYDRELYWE